MVKICLLIIITLFMSTTVLAQSSKEYPLLWDLTSGDYEIWSDGLDVNIESAGEYLELQLDSSNLTEKEYYTTHIYKTGAFDWREYGELVFKLSNLSSHVLKINFIITDHYYEQYRLTEDMPVLMLSENSTIKELIPNMWSAAEIPANFIGELHIPDYNVTENVLEHIISFGISITVPKGMMQSFKISNIRLIPEQYSSNVYGFEIVGDKEIQLPVMGESISFYNVVFKDVYTNGKYTTPENVTFGICDNIAGVSITADGKLTISENLQSKNFTIYADINDEVRDSIPITVVDHWSKEQEIETASKSHLPTVNEIKPIKDNNDILYDSKTVEIIRNALIVAALFVCGLYFLWMNISRGGTNEN